MTNFKLDCRHFRFDRPCLPHKTEGAVCPTCTKYDGIKERVLVIKLEAAGDVLRTTALLGPLKRKFPHSQVIWVTKRNSSELLKNLTEVDEVVAPDSDLVLKLATEEFDLVLNPDAAPESARIASAAKAKNKIGFFINSRGHVVPTNERAAAWFETGVNDTKKKENKKTYQQWLLETLELPFGNGPGDWPILWRVSEQERRRAIERISEKFGDDKNKIYVGLNTGAGGRWKYKKWTLEGYTALIKKLCLDDPRVRILLYGGEGEEARNKTLALVHPDKVLDTGNNNSLREFGALVERCDVMVTGDTMALHLAAALQKPVVGLFGPTSHSEIEIYGKGEKIFANMACLVCYLNDCDVRPTCMDQISAERVCAAVHKQLDLLKK